MKIPNYDPKNFTTNDHKQGQPSMPADVFRMLICGPSCSRNTNIMLNCWSYWRVDVIISICMNPIISCFFVLKGPGDVAMCNNESSTSCNTALPCSFWSDRRAKRLLLLRITIVLNFPSTSDLYAAPFLLFCLSCSQSHNNFPSVIRLFARLFCASSLSIFFFLLLSEICLAFADSSHHVEKIKRLLVNTQSICCLCFSR